MNEDDRAAVSSLLCECYRWLGERERLTADQIEFLVSKRGSLECVTRESRTQLYLVASEEDEIVGMVSVSGNEITKLYVSPACHRKGIGRQLFIEAESAIRDSGHRDLMLGAFPSAVPFYRAMGLSVTGRKPGALGAFSMIIMTKRLGDGSPQEPCD
jgi:ribosomal protein S18 acetylase RimI-like enzyme